MHVRLELSGRGHLNGENVSALRQVIGERGTAKGYGFVFDYRSGDLDIAMEEARLAPDAMGRNPVEKFSSDLDALAACLPRTFNFKLTATLTVHGTDQKTRYSFVRDSAGRLKRKISVTAADASGASSDDAEKSRWSDLRVTIPIIALAALIAFLLHHFGIVKLR